MAAHRNRVYVSKSEAEQLRRVIGGMIRPRMRLTELATKHDVPYDMLKDFLRARTTSFETETNRDKIRALAHACLPELNLTTLEDAASLGSYCPRGGAKDDGSVPVEPTTHPNPDPVKSVAGLKGGLGHKILALLRRIPPAEELSKISGIFTCYRALTDDRVVQSQMAISRRESFRGFEFVEQWSRKPGEIIEYWGYVVPDKEGLIYFIGLHKEFAYPKMMVGRMLKFGEGIVAIKAISTAPAPGQPGFLSGNVYMERSAFLPTGRGALRDSLTIGQTGDRTLSDLSDRAKDALTENDAVPGFARIARPEKTAW